MNAEELLTQIHSVAGDKIRANGFDLLNAVLRRHAHLTVGDARELVAAGLHALKARGRVKLPAGRHLWDYSSRAAIPLWISVVRSSPETPSWSYCTHPWHPSLGFVSELKFLPNGEEVLALDRWLRSMRDDEPHVPIKERSWEIFGEEKKLEALIGTKLFDAGRLTLEALRCYVVAHVPVHRIYSKGAPLLIISENEAGFDSLCRAAAEFGAFRVVVFGNGLAVEKAVSFLVDAFEQQNVSECLYVGDVDEAGLAIPYRVNLALSRTASRLSVQPWVAAYSLMLRGIELEKPSGSQITWLPAPLSVAAHRLISEGKRVAQESCGWKQIREMVRPA